MHPGSRSVSVSCSPYSFEPTQCRGACLTLFGTYLLLGEDTSPSKVVVKSRAADSPVCEKEAVQESWDLNGVPGGDDRVDRGRPGCAEVDGGGYRRSTVT